MTFICDVCQITFKSKKTLSKHLKTQKHLSCTDKDVKKYTCSCGKWYTHKKSLYNHQKVCTYDNSIQEVSIQNDEPEVHSTPIEKQLEDLKSTIEEERHRHEEERRRYHEEMDELRKQVEMLMEKSTGNITNNNSNSNNNNTHIETQNIILVNSFGNENTDYLTDQIITKLIKNNGPATCIPKIIESIHFDPEHPENHNIKVTNQKNNYAKVIKENKWVTVNKKRTIENMIETGYVLLEEKYQDNKDSVSEFRQNRFRDFQDKYENQDKEMMKIIKDEVDLTVINGTEEIYKK